jgi:hypothetical protein
MLYLFDRCYRKGDPKMMHVRHDSLLYVVNSAYPMVVALCTDTAGIQRWRFLCASVC